MALDKNTQELFLEEVRENLRDLEAALLELEEGEGEKQDCVDRVFRALHTVKGIAAMVGEDRASDFAHQVENIFDAVRSDLELLQPELIELTLCSRDHLRAVLRGADVQDTAGEQIVRQMAELVHVQNAEPEPFSSSLSQNEGEPLQEFKSFRIRFRPEASSFVDGVDFSSLFAELRALGELSIVLRTDAVPRLDAYESDRCFLGWDMVLQGHCSENAVRDAFIFVDSAPGVVTLELLPFGAEAQAGKNAPKLGDILMQRGAVSADEVLSALSQQRKLGELLEDSGAVSSEEIESALVEQTAVKRARERIQQSTRASSVRVPAERLDEMVSLVGELALVQTQISQAVGTESRHHLERLSEELERLSVRLRERTLSMRMLPIGNMLTRFRRLIHDLSRELNKKIELETVGEETEVDKTVFEHLGDPLVHIVRNCADHGIESPEERIALGKPATGTVRVSAEHAGGEVRIIIEDDGRGMDPEKILARARELNLVSGDKELQRSEILALVFEPGFTTSSTVTSLSGRGVGLDVVQRGIQALRGSVEVESTRDTGTRFLLRIPLTLAIIEGLQVRVADEYYVIPLSVVQECREFVPHDAQVLDIRGEIIPWVRLHDLFGLSGDCSTAEQLVVAKLGNRRVGLVVDLVVGEHQTVIRSLGPVYNEVQGFSGATVRADGTMALILDVQEIFKMMGGCRISDDPVCSV